MYASGRTDNISGLSIIHLPDGVRERTCGVDHAFGFDLKLLSGEFVPKRVKMNVGNRMDTRQQATGWVQGNRQQGGYKATGNMMDTRQQAT